MHIALKTLFLIAMLQVMQSGRYIALQIVAGEIPPGKKSNQGMQTAIFSE
jgi:hypothetical protein